MLLKQKLSVPPNMQLEQIDIPGLEQRSVRFDVFYDLHTYMRYVIEKRIKRTYRTNDLSKSDIKRLLGLMSITDKECQEHLEGTRHWPGFIDDLAYRLSFVKYDTKGVYAGYYSSGEPTFPDNYIRTNKEAYEKFIALPLQQQVAKILEVLVGFYTDYNNEFMSLSVTSHLDKFDSRGCATGALPFLKFDQSRNFLLVLLSKLQPNIWYSTSSLIQYLKYNYHYFLIPEKPQFKFTTEKSRYCNFLERAHNDYKRLEISENAPDAFERVEGRYVERFLEYIPLIMGFVDVAYDPKCETTISPQRDKLKAFKVNPRMSAFYNGEICQPKITVLPNFEISIESEIYPSLIMHELTNIGKLIVSDKVSQVKIEKTKIIAKVAQDPSFNPITYLQNLSIKPLPQNVEVDLKEWTNQGDAIILYEDGCLLECDYQYDFISDYSVERINNNISIIHDTKSLLMNLEKEHSVPIEIVHKNNNFKLLPTSYVSVFPKLDKETAINQDLKKLTIKRQILLKFFFPSLNEVNLIKNELLSHHCIFDIDEATSSIIIEKKDEDLLKAAIQTISNAYHISIQDETVA